MLSKEQLELLEAFHKREYKEGAYYEGESVITVAYAETESGTPVEVSIDLDEMKTVYKINGKIFEEESIESQEELTELLRNLSYDDLMSDVLYKAESDETWTIPVTWEVYGRVEVKGLNREEALKNFKKSIDSISLPTDPDYVEGSFALSSDSDEETLAMME